MPSAEEIKRKLKALDAIDAYLDDRDAEDGRKMKEGTAEDEAAHADADDSGLGKDASPASDDDKGAHEATQELSLIDDMDLRSELKKMSASNPGAKSALSMFEEEQEEED